MSSGGRPSFVDERPAFTKATGFQGSLRHNSTVQGALRQGLKHISRIRPTGQSVYGTSSPSSSLSNSQTQGSATPGSVISPTSGKPRPLPPWQQQRATSPPGANRGMSKVVSSPTLLSQAEENSNIANATPVAAKPNRPPPSAPRRPPPVAPYSSTHKPQPQGAQAGTTTATPQQDASTLQDQVQSPQPAVVFNTGKSGERSGTLSIPSRAARPKGAMAVASGVEAAGVGQVSSSTARATLGSSTSFEIVGDSRDAHSSVGSTSPAPHVLSNGVAANQVSLIQ